MASTRRLGLLVTWIAANVVYAAVRTIVAWATVSRYGVSVFGFAAVEVGSSIPYAVATGRFVTALADIRRHDAASWGALALFCFPMPEVYVGIAGRGMPAPVYYMLGGAIGVAGAIGIVTLSRRVRTTASQTR